MITNYEVFGNRVLLKKMDEPVGEKTEGGIILPIETQERAEQNKTIFFAEVILKGNDVELVEVGDIVIFNERSSSPILLDGEEYNLAADSILIGRKK